METLLIVARIVQFAADISLAGIFAFECFIAVPAFRRAGADYAEEARLRRRFRLLAWASLGLVLLSGAGWLFAVGASMSGEPLGAVLSQGILGVVLTQTRFGEDWFLRFAAAVLLGALLVVQPRSPRWLDAAIRWTALALATVLLASLAWAGHGAATAGEAGDLHLAGDILHLLAAGAWLGTLPPFALLLVEARHHGDANWPAVGRVAARRYSLLAIASVTALLTGGIVNTWFLAGTIPALVGTEYGRLLLGKITLFVAMLLVASVNLLRLTPRLSSATGAVASRTAGQLRRNALIEGAFGLGVLGIVGLLGILPPGLHTEPGWPFPFRLNFAALTVGSTVAVAILAGLVFSCAVAVVATTAAGRYRLSAGLLGALVLCAAIGAIPLAPAFERAYPTSFYAPAQPYAAASIIRGATIYANDCAACHGPTGEGNGPAAAGLPIRPANLTEPHLFAHRPGDLFWWVGNGRDNGVMPGFAKVLKPGQRWDVINFILARAAGDQVQEVGPSISTAPAYPVPDFAFQRGAVQNTLRRVLQRGPVLLVLFSRPVPTTRLQELAAQSRRLAAAGLHILAVDLHPAAEGGQDEGKQPPLVVAGSDPVRQTLALFRSANDGGESELLLDRNGDVRARWTAVQPGELPDAHILAADAARAARFAVAAPSHAGHH
jgi:putative copper resistance protein D